MEIKKVDISLLDNWDKNPRGIKEKDFNRLKQQIKNLGVYKALVACKENERYIVLGGNMRLRAYKELGHKEVFITEVEAKTDKRKTEIALSDNDSVGYYEYDKLYELLEPLKDDFNFEDFKVDIEGLKNIPLESVFNDIQIKEIEGEDDVPEIKKTNIKLGDMFELGTHRLLCGDSTKKEDVERLMQGERVDIVFTDPPYGINIVKVTGKIGGDKPFGSTTNKGKDRICKANVYSPILNDDKPFDPKHLFDMAKNQIIFGANYFTSKLNDNKAWIVWDKEVSGTFSEVELAYTSFEGKLRIYRYMWSGMRRQGNRADELIKRVHPTQKPVGLFIKIFNDYEFKSCIDPYLGSGTTLIACEKTQRICYGMELAPEYCQVIIDRWEQFTGKKAKQIDS